MPFCLTVIHKIDIIRRSPFYTKPSSSNLNRRFGRVSFIACLLPSLSVQVVVDVNYKQDACDNPVTSHFPYRYFPLLQVV